MSNEKRFRINANLRLSESQLQAIKEYMASDKKLGGYLAECHFSVNGKTLDSLVSRGIFKLWESDGYRYFQSGNLDYYSAWAYIQGGYNRMGCGQIANAINYLLLKVCTFPELLKSDLWQALKKRSKADLNVILEYLYMEHIGYDHLSYSENKTLFQAYHSIKFLLNRNKIMQKRIKQSQENYRVAIENEFAENYHIIRINMWLLSDHKRTNAPYSHRKYIPGYKGE